MQRFLMQDLIQWKSSSYRKPLILQGVRQCGKTYLLKKFASRHYREIAYFNFEGNPALAELFKSNLEPGRIITDIALT